MLPRVSVHRFCCAPFTDVANYRRFVGDELIDEIDELARELDGIRVCHLNSTGFGGGVAELLSRHVPLLNAVGIRTDWRLLPFEDGTGSPAGGARGDPAFNLTIDTAPIGDEDQRYFLWHIDVLPRLTTPAGFELGSGMSINSVLPEHAASALRSAEGQ
jgi:hypothetical protein